MRTSGGAPAVIRRSVPLLAHSSSSQGSMSSMTRMAPSGGIRGLLGPPEQCGTAANSANVSPATFSHAPTNSPPCSTVTAAHGPKGRSGATPAATSGTPWRRAQTTPSSPGAIVSRGRARTVATTSKPTSSGQVRPSMRALQGNSGSPGSWQRRTPKPASSRAAADCSMAQSSVPTTSTRRDRRSRPPRRAESTSRPRGRAAPPSPSSPPVPHRHECEASKPHPALRQINVNPTILVTRPVSRMRAAASVGYFPDSDRVPFPNVGQHHYGRWSWH